MSVSWTCPACGCENLTYRSMCRTCGAAHLRSSIFDRALFQQHFAVTVTVGMSAITAGVLLWYYGALLGLAVGSQVCAFGVVALQHARRQRAVSAERRLAEDARPPILYIRPFLTDGNDELEAHEPPLWLLFVLPVVWLILYWTRRKTYEERLAATLNCFGPCITVGRPHEKLPELGFSRLYTDDANWQQVVSAMLARAQLVLVRAEHITASIRWELSAFVASASPRQMILFFPYEVDAYDGDAERAYSSFCHDVRDIFPVGLPAWRHGALFITFEGNWSPTLVTRSGSLESTIANVAARSTSVEVTAYAGFWVRLASSVIDTLFIGLGIFVTSLGLYVVAGIAGIPGPVLDELAAYLVLVVPPAVLVTLWRSAQTTVGKLTLGLRVLDSRSGRPPVMWQCVVRYLGYIINIASLGVGFFWIAVDRRKQGWHDKLARTIVVPRYWRPANTTAGGPRRGEAG